MIITRREEKWTEEVFEEYGKEQEKGIKKHVEDTSEIVIEALKSLSDKKLEKYLRCINVFFGKDKSMFEKMME